MDYSTVWHVFLLFVLMIMVVWFSISRGKIIHKNPDLQSQKAEVKIDSPKNRKKLKKQLPFLFSFSHFCAIYVVYMHTGMLCMHILHVCEHTCARVCMHLYTHACEDPR